VKFELRTNKIEAYIEPGDIDGVAKQVDEQSARMLWYLWHHRHAKLDELKKASGEASHIKVLMRIMHAINPAAMRLLGRPIMVFERSAMDYSTGEHIFHSWWLNEEATSTHPEISKRQTPKPDSKPP